MFVSPYIATRGPIGITATRPNSQNGIALHYRGKLSPKDPVSRVYEEFYADPAHLTCPSCGAM
jgi:hypothetical protein